MIGIVHTFLCAWGPGLGNYQMLICGENTNTKDVTLQVFDCICWGEKE